MLRVADELYTLGFARYSTATEGQSLKGTSRGTCPPRALSSTAMALTGAGMGRSIDLGLRPFRTAARQNGQRHPMLHRRTA